MFAFVRNDPTHALGDRLVLQVNTINAAVDGAAALRRSIDLPVIVWVGREPPTSVPVCGIGEEFVHAPGATDSGAVLACRRRSGQCGITTLPPQKTKHRMVIVHRHPGTRMHMTGELAVRCLRP